MKKSQFEVNIPKPPYMGEGGEWKLFVTKKINILLGKNGSGKSALFRSLSKNSSKNYSCLLVSPERGGYLETNANIRNQMEQDPNWDVSTRWTNNQVPDFKHRSATKWQSFCGSILADAISKKNEGVIKEIKSSLKILNKLLPNVSIDMDKNQRLQFFNKYSNKPIKPNQLSSGEGEAITLAIECIDFAYTTESQDTQFLLLLDEPDLHLHPDLQKNIINFLFTLSNKNKNLFIIIATHSLASLTYSLGGNKKIGIHWMTNKNNEIEFVESNTKMLDFINKIGDYFLNESILLIEGEEDKQIWAKAISSSNQKIKIRPVDCGGKPQLKTYEGILNTIFASMHYPSKEFLAFSLRDRDDSTDAPPDKIFIKRFILNCSEIENCFLSDEVLSLCKTSWAELKEKIKMWLEASNKSHQAYNILNTLIADKNDSRMNCDIKDAMGVLRGLVNNNNPPWKDKVGQAIGQLALGRNKSSKNSLMHFLGDDLVKIIIKNER